MISSRLFRTPSANYKKMGAGYIEVVKMKSIYHVHTERCGHAKGSDREIIEACIAVGADSVYITDHAPFPKDPFENRMKYRELPEYINSFSRLKAEYKKDIEIHLGLEIEYFSQFDDYYKKLSNDSGLDVGLFLGQHIYYSEKDKAYSFDLESSELKAEEYRECGKAIIDAIRTGCFTRIAHPDRIFRRSKGWSDDYGNVAERIIDEAAKYHIPLEVNNESLERKLLRPQFWELACKRDMPIYVGLDAHSVSTILKYDELIDQLKSWADRKCPALLNRLDI